jgi:hypothetical protein
MSSKCASSLANLWRTAKCAGLPSHVAKVLRTNGRKHPATLVVSGGGVGVFLGFLQNTNRGVRYWREFRQGILLKDYEDMEVLRLSLNAPADSFWKTATQQRWCRWEARAAIVEGTQVVEHYETIYHLPVAHGQEWGGEIEAALPFWRSDSRDIPVFGSVSRSVVEEFGEWLNTFRKADARRKRKLDGNLDLTSQLGALAALAQTERQSNECGSVT